MSSVNDTESPNNANVQYRAGIFESVAHYLQLLNLSHSRYNIFAWILKPVISLITLYQSIGANKGAYLYRKRLIHGPNFVCAGGVWLSQYPDVKKNLLEPQARAFKLAPSQLRKSVLPASNFGHRFNFLLSLSQRGAGGNGDWEAYRMCMEHTLFAEKTSLRLKDETSKALVQKLAEDYQTTSFGQEPSFYTDNNSGLKDFLARYLHYVIFGLDPFDEAIMKEIKTLHYDMLSATYHLAVIGPLLQFFKFGRKWPKQFQIVAKIYEESPAISSLLEGQDKCNNMSQAELSLLMVSIMSLAGMVGPFTAANIVLGNRKLSPFEGKKTDQINVETVWDTLNLDNRDEVKRYIHECGRLRHPVSNTHKVAQENFVARIRNRDVEFSKGTIIFIPMQLASIDENEYGKSTFHFDHNRENLCPRSTFFHSVGDETNGRICPGKHIAEEMLIDVLIALGKIRKMN
mmetsp:Transcript_7665/g.11483  ORF Transcript_7665/g.11483 Transcript_7665/m.11483 type:complete len:459 (+) Transcript_7665:67-1443(+)